MQFFNANYQGNHQVGRYEPLSACFKECGGASAAKNNQVNQQVGRYEPLSACFKECGGTSAAKNNQVNQQVGRYEPLSACFKECGGVSKNNNTSFGIEAKFEQNSVAAARQYLHFKKDF